MQTKTRTLLLASLASALTLPALARPDKPAMEKKDAKGEMAHCYGVNKCKGMCDCSGAGHSCKGMNSCKHMGYIDMDKATCLKIDGGRLTEAEEKAKEPAKEKAK